MPLKQLNSTMSNLGRMRLVEELAKEWSSPTADTNAPTILEQSAGSGGSIHVYVVWESWRSTDTTERHEIVMDAAEIAKPLDDVMRITQAWALLPEEADRMNIPWR